LILERHLAVFSLRKRGKRIGRLVGKGKKGSRMGEENNM
jgi:hypothetical protein